MEIGIYTFGETTPDPATGRTISARQRLRDLMEEIELADRVGLDVFAIGEHHRPDFAVSAPAVVLAAACMVRDAIPRSDPASIAAASAIGRDRAFRGVDELAVIDCPTLVFPGLDWRHPAAVAEEIARVLRNGSLAPVALSADVLSAEDFAQAFAPAIRDFLVAVERDR